MHRARDDALQQLSLTEHDRRLVADAARHVVRAIDGPPRPDEPDEEERAPSGDVAGGGDERREREGAGDDRYDARTFLSSAVIAGTTSCRSPITA
jgi:hypothetical protein